MGQAITERRIMGVWVFDLDDAETARSSTPTCRPR
jgi:hypothetical protein